MIPRLPMATLLASLAVHGGAVAILFFLVSGESHPSVLFIDLEAIEERGLPAATTAAGGSAGSPRAARSEAGRSSRPSAPAPVRSSPAPSAAPSEPEPAREPEVSPAPAPEPRQPEPAVAVVPAREAAPDTPPRAESSSSPAEPAPNAGGAGSTGERVASPSEQGSGGQAALTPGSSTQGSGGAGGTAGLGSGGPAGGAPGAEYGSYLAGVRQRILDALRYPPPARSRGLTGTVYLEIFIKSDGAIGDVAVTNSSSHPLLDEAALEAVRSLSPQPFPKGLKPRPLRVRLPVVFDLQ